MPMLREWLQNPGTKRKQKDASREGERNVGAETGSVYRLGLAVNAGDNANKRESYSMSKEETRDP